MRIAVGKHSKKDGILIINCENPIQGITGNGDGIMLSKNGYSTSVLIETDCEQKVLMEEEALNDVLQKYGIRVFFAGSRYQGWKGLRRYTLRIVFDHETHARGAGRKPRECGMDMEEALCLEEKGMEKKEIAGLMGVSVATYYRKRKAYLSADRGVIIPRYQPMR